MSKAEFVPAIGEQFNSVWQRKLEYKGFDMKFFTKQSHFQHDIALQCGYYGIEGVGKKSKDVRYRDLVKFPKDKTLITDSGGFQIASFAKKGQVCDINPIDSLRWQEENGDIAVNLDVPPNLDGNPSYQDFIAALDTSYNNFKLFEKERKNYDMWLYNVLHGETYEMMDIWYNKVKDFKFDGWAIGLKPPFDPMLQAVGIMFLWEKGEFDKESCKGIHFFGTSGKMVVPTIVYAASKLKQRVTYDSSSYNIGSLYRTYYLPFDIGPHLSFGDKFKRINPHLKTLPCSCPVCSSITDISILNGKDIFAGTLISLHNLYQYKIYCRVLNEIVYDKDLFVDYLNKINASEKCKMSIEFIDFAIDKGLKNAINKYSNYLIPQHLNKNRQVSIFNF